MAQSSMTGEIQTLIQQGQSALQAGNAFEARKYFRRATEIDPDNAEVWIGMASAVRPLKEQHEHLQHALTLDPTNATAQSRLADVEARLAAGEVLAPPLVSRQEDHASIEASTSENETPDTVSEPPQASHADPAVETLYCYRHPDRETGLRCVQCGNPICTECIRPAFVGQLCPDCARERRPRNYQVSAGNLAVAAPVTLLIALGVSYLLVQFLPAFGFFMLIISFFLGSIVAELIVRLLDRVTQAKRGKEMQLTVGISYSLGAAPFVLLFALVGVLHLSFFITTITAIVMLVQRLR